MRMRKCVYAVAALSLFLVVGFLVSGTFHAAAILFKAEVLRDQTHDQMLRASSVNSAATAARSHGDDAARNSSSEPRRRALATSLCNASGEVPTSKASERAPPGGSMRGRVTSRTAPSSGEAANQRNSSDSKETNVTASVAKDAGRVTGDTGEDMKEVDAKNRTFLIIVSYHRSGSSLVGEIFNNHPDVMYFFEPMVIFPEFRAHDFDPWLARKRCTIAHGATIASNVIANATRLLADMHACDWSRIAAFSRDHRRWPNWPQYLSRSRAIARAAGCDSRVDFDRALGCNLTIAAAAAPRLDAICRTHRHHVVKTVRLHVADLLPLLKSGADVRVVYLVRDPRAVIASRRKIGIKPVVASKIRAVCDDMQTNWATARDAGVPADRLLVLRYEDFVTDIKTYSRDLLRFAGIDYDAAVGRYIDEIALGGRQRAGEPENFSTYRNDSAAHAYGWKSALSPAETRAIEKTCAPYLESLGFAPTLPEEEKPQEKLKAKLQEKPREKPQEKLKAKLQEKPREKPQEKPREAAEEAGSEAAGEAEREAVGEAKSEKQQKKPR